MGAPNFCFSTVVPMVLWVYSRSIVNTLLRSSKLNVITSSGPPVAFVLRFPSCDPVPQEISPVSTISVITFFLVFLGVRFLSRPLVVYCLVWAISVSSHSMASLIPCVLGR